MIIDALAGVDGGLASVAHNGAWSRAIQRHHFLAGLHKSNTALQKRVSQLTAERIDSELGEDAGRADAFDANAGTNLALDLTHMHSEVLKEPRPIRSALQIFARDTSVPFGARQVRVVRQYGTGRAQLHRAGENIPRVGIARKEEFFPVVYPVAGYGMDIFEQASSRFAGSSLPSDKASECVDAIEELLNHLAWNGDDNWNVQGVLNYKWLARRTITTGFSAATVAANPNATLAALTDLVRWPQMNSKGAMKPDSVCFSENVDAALSQVLTTTYGNATLRELFLKSNPHIKNVFVVPELEGAGGAGIDGIFAFLKAGRRGVRMVLPRGVTFLPMQNLGLDMLVPAYAATGGIRMEDIGNQILGLVDITA